MSMSKYPLSFVYHRANDRNTSKKAMTPVMLISSTSVLLRAASPEDWPWLLDVGSDVGFADSKSRVSNMLGALVIIVRVGNAIGLALGATVGSRVGLDVGVKDGETLGKHVGSTVGLPVGD